MSGEWTEQTILIPFARKDGMFTTAPIPARVCAPFAVHPRLVMDWSTGQARAGQHAYSLTLLPEGATLCSSFPTAAAAMEAAERVRPLACWSEIRTANWFDLIPERQIPVIFAALEYMPTGALRETRAKWRRVRRERRVSVQERLL